MSEQEKGQPADPSPPASASGSAVGKAGLAGLGAAIIAAHLAVCGAIELYRHFQNAADAGNRVLDKSFAYDLSSLRKVDPALIKYHELSRIETGLGMPRAIAVDPQQALLVAGDRTVRRFTRTGGFSDIISLADTPYALAAHPDGSVFVALKDHVETYGPDGKRKAVWNSFGDRSYLTCIAIAGDDVYVADAGRRVVLHCSPDGKVLHELGKPDSAQKTPGLIVPSPHLDVAVGSDGLIWVANPGMHRLEAYTRDGRLERFWGSQGTAIQEFFGCCNPTDFALLSDGSFITAEKGIARVKRYHPDGRFDCVVAAPDAFSDNMIGLDVATDAEGRVLVLGRGARSVRVFAASTGGAP